MWGIRYPLLRTRRTSANSVLKLSENVSGGQEWGLVPVIPAHGGEAEELSRV